MAAPPASRAPMAALSSTPATPPAPRSAVRAVRDALPTGKTLPVEEFDRRHGVLLSVLWLHALLLPAFALAEGLPVAHALVDTALVALPAIVATVARRRRHLSAALVSLGLMTSSAVLVHLAAGTIEAHFHFFVVIVLLALYEEWTPLLLAVGYVLVHHGVVGTIDPQSVYDHPAAAADPWPWTALHAAFFTAATAGAIATWRLNEAVRERALAAERRAARAAAELARSNQDLQDFASVASHDLREPLRTIGGFAALMERRHGADLAPEAREMLGHVLDGTARMQALIDGVLELAGAHSVELAMAPVDLAAVLHEVLSDLDDASRRTGAVIETGALPTLPGDARLLRRLLQNLIANALKFSGDRPPWIRVDAERTPEGWAVSVADAGIGIPPDRAAQVFAMFTRVHDRDRYEGSGIGLAVCARIAQRHGGDIAFAPRHGGGSVFTRDAARDLAAGRRVEHVERLADARDLQDAPDLGRPLRAHDAEARRRAVLLRLVVRLHDGPDPAGVQELEVAEVEDDVAAVAQRRPDEGLHLGRPGEIELAARAHEQRSGLLGHLDAERLRRRRPSHGHHPRRPARRTWAHPGRPVGAGAAQAASSAAVPTAPHWPLDAPPRLVRRPLDGVVAAHEAARWLRGAPHAAALIGAWAGGGAVLADDPVWVAAGDEDPFALLDRTPRPAETVAPVRHGVYGGWLGWLGFGLGRRLEPVPPPPPRPVALPPFAMAFHDHVVRRDPEGRWAFEALWTPGREEALEAAHERWRARLAQDPPPAGPVAGGPLALVAPGGDGHRAAVAACRERIAAGEIFQANVCLRLEGELEGDPLDLWCAGAGALQPAYAAYVAGPWGAIASLSPELFLRRRGREVLSEPIKGTAREAPGAREALAASAKDRAENVMIADLVRNDLGPRERVRDGGRRRPGRAAPGAGRLAPRLRRPRHAAGGRDRRRPPARDVPAGLGDRGAEGPGPARHPRAGGHGARGLLRRDRPRLPRRRAGAQRRHPHVRGRRRPRLARRRRRRRRRLRAGGRARRGARQGRPARGGGGPRAGGPRRRRGRGRRRRPCAPRRRSPRAATGPTRRVACSRPCSSPAARPWRWTSTSRAWRPAPRRSGSPPRPAIWPAEHAPPPRRSARGACASCTTPRAHRCAPAKGRRCRPAGRWSCARGCCPAASAPTSGPTGGCSTRWPPTARCRCSSTSTARCSRPPTPPSSSGAAASWSRRRWTGGACRRSAAHGCCARRTSTSGSRP